MRTIACAVAVALCLGAGSSLTAETRNIVPTTTLTAETGNNTSTASSFVAQANGNLGPSNISKVPINTLLYSGNTTAVYAHFMPWFGQASHMDVGYASNDPAQVNAQVTDALSRGITAFLEDWYGPDNAMPNDTQFVLMREAEARAGAFFFGINYDGGALKTCNATAGCDLTQQAISDLKYAYNTFEQSPAYLRFNGRPVITFFDPDRFGTLNWSLIQSSVPGNPLFIFRNSGGFTHSATSGSFAWIIISPTNPDDWAQVYLDNFYNKGLLYPAQHPMGAVYKGFNDTLAGWGKNRIMNQNCGQTWLNTFADVATHYSATGTQLESIQLATWNDYEEGSELESGIDNCVSISASLNGVSLNWAITGSETTLDHYTIFISTDGENLMSLGDVPAGTHAFDLAGVQLAPATYTLYVKAVGKPSMLNHMSGAVSYTVSGIAPVAVLSVTPATGTAPMNVSASTSASTAVSGDIASSTIDFGDGSAATNGPSAAHTYAAPGEYSVTAKVSDQYGMSGTTTQMVSVINQPPLAALSVTPASGIAPVTVTATTSASSDPDGSIAGSIIDFGDGTAVSGPTATHTYNTPGTYSVTATVYDNLNASSKATQAITVAANKAPIAALSVTPTSGVGPLAVTASTAASSDPDGSIAGSVINFGDGVVVAAASATHTYATAGAYTVTATVTDNFGLSASTTSLITVSAPGVTVSSPVGANGTLNSNVHVVASAASSAGITAMRIYLDSVSVYLTSTSQIDTYIATASGQHSLTVKAWDTLNNIYKNSQTITVANQSPIAKLTLSATGGIAPFAVTASTTGSSDPDGSIASTAIDFGDGTVLSGATASHTYSNAGAYTVKATVTDNLGASSSATQQVAVTGGLAIGVIVSSPLQGPVYGSPVHFVARAAAANGITAMKIYVDHIGVYTVNASQIDTNVGVASGTHAVTVQAWDSAGAVYKNSFLLTVQ